MSPALLDTPAFLWWILDDPQLSATARSLIADPGTEVIVSVVTAWEIAIKAATGRLDVPPDVSAFEQLRLNGFQALPVQLAHALRVHGPPAIHAGRDDLVCPASHAQDRE